MSFALLAVSTLLAFGCLVGFESALAGVDARATALGLEIAAQNQALLAGENVERSAHAVESGIQDLHLTDSLRHQITALFEDLEAIAQRRNVQVTAFRHEGNARFVVTVEGEYPATLSTLADLSSLHVAAQASTVLFERANGHVRAAFSLDVFRLGESSVRANLP
jgi:hypothetical protein